MNLWGPIGVCWFELRRSLSIGRLLLWLLMVSFPVLLIIAIRAAAAQAPRSSGPPEEAYIFIMFALIVRVACVMGLLLWATPLISNEVEGRTWVYIVSRPTGSRSIVLGKYLVAIVWAISAGIVSATISVPLAGIENSFTTWAALCVLVVLGSLAYGALFTVIGAFIQRKAMVIAIIYLVLFEGVLSLVPATINRLTVGHRLLAIYSKWLDIVPENEQTVLLVGESSPMFNVCVLFAISATLIMVAIGRVRLGGYLTAPED